MTGRILASAIALLLPATAIAAPPGETPSIAKRRKSDDDLTRIGLGTDVGVPDGATASLVVRPVRALRLHVGGGHNYVSPGVRAGITLVPLSWWFSPTLSLDVGRYFEGDANPLARMISGDSSFSAKVLERVGYDYVNAHAGLEFGRKRFTFYIHAGMSHVTTQVHELSVMSEDTGAGVSFVDDPRIDLWTVSARVGLILYVK
jgi:hypothetical protein